MPPVAAIIFGVSACGKSSVARALAEGHGCAYIDADDCHSDAAVAKMSSGNPLTDEDREPWLLRVAQAAVSALEADGAACVAVACSALGERHRKRLRQAILDSAAVGDVLFVLLNVGEDEIRRRLAARQGEAGGHFFRGDRMARSQFEALEVPHGDVEDYLEIKVGAEHPDTDAAGKCAAIAWGFIEARLGQIASESDSNPGEVDY